MSESPSFLTMNSPWTVGEIVLRSFVLAYRPVISLIFAAALHLFIATWLMSALSKTGLGQSRKVSQPTTIGSLPEEVLLNIFSFDRLVSLTHSRGPSWEWYRLVHVCQRWRSIIFDSPRYLDLQLHCTHGTPVRDNLDCWPALPIVMRYARSSNLSPPTSLPVAIDEDNIIAALQHPDRMYMIQLTVTTSLLERLATLRQESFPKLLHLELVTQTETGLTLPSECFGGNAPRLQILRTTKIGFSALPHHLLSAPNLISLQLEAVPSTGYISPEVLTTCLSTTTCLRMFHLHFLSTTPLLISRDHQRPERYVVLPALKYITFQGCCEYLERLLSGIHVPNLNYLDTSFFNQATDFDVAQLLQFVFRTDMPRSYDEAGVFFSATDISLTLIPGGTPHRMGFRVRCVPLDWQLSCMAEICDKLSSIISSVQLLDIDASSSLSIRQGDMDFLSWLEFFRPFSNVWRLRVTEEVASHVASALGKEVSMGVLPRMQELYLEDRYKFSSAQEDLAPFTTMRRHSDYPVTVHHWETRHAGQPAADNGHAGPTGILTSFIHRYDPILALEKVFRDSWSQFCRYPRSVTVQSLFQQAQFLLLPFMENGGRVEALTNSIVISHDLLEMHTKEIRRVKLIVILALSFGLRGQWPGYMARSISLFESAFHDESATVAEKLGIAWCWATFARIWGHPSTTLAYQNTLSAMKSSLIGGFTTQLWSVSISHLGSVRQIPFDYASYQIERGQLELAIDTIEQGKTLIWSEMYGLRSSAGRLHSVDPGLADQLTNVTQTLEIANASFTAPDAIESLLCADELDDIYDVIPAVKDQRRLQREVQDVIRKIQDLPDFGNFMRPIPFHTLHHAAFRGPIIIINHCHWHCDILIIVRDSPPALIPTPEGFLTQFNILAFNLGMTRRDLERYHHALEFILLQLYEYVGKPVIRKLQEMGIRKQSRIWWYPTSAFCSLPLHAMGPIPSTDGHEQYFSDIYVCSYISTLGALIEARTPKTDPDLTPSLLFVAPAVPASGFEREMMAIKKSRIPITPLVNGGATKQAVIDGLQKHPFAHFSCCGVHNVGDPFSAEILLDCNERLSLLDVVHTRIPTTELIVLLLHRNPGTVETEGGLEELGLASIMHHYGYRSVVGTLWSVLDGDGQDFSEAFYTTLLSRGTAQLGEKSAEALRFAVQRLRREGMPLERWVNWIHYGV